MSEHDIELLVKTIIERTSSGAVKWRLDTIGNYTLGLTSASLELDRDELTIYNPNGTPILVLRDQHDLAYAIEQAHRARALEVIDALLAEIGEAPTQSGEGG